MRVLRVYFTHHQMQPTGKFKKVQAFENFPPETPLATAIEQLEFRHGKHSDDSWKAKKGFVDGFQSAFCDTGKAEPAEPAPRETEGQLFSGVEMMKCQGKKPPLTPRA